MKKILMIGTGGTIASELTASGLSPELTSEQILEYIPSIKNFCEVGCVQICNIDSTNILPQHWLLMAKTIQQNYWEYDGFVICHGTDTMAYTAAALSYLVQNSPKPIIITGSQKPINTENTDSKINLLDSFICAASGSLNGVQIVFNGKVILGTRARKTRTKSFQAFSSINYPNLAVIQDGYLMQYIQEPTATGPNFYENLNDRVTLLKLIPGMDADILSYMLQKNDAVIIESYGVGGIPSWSDRHFYDAIEKGIASGKTVVMTTQVPNEGSDLAIYNVGHILKKNLKVLEAFDMTTEAVVSKLMWILGKTSDPKEIQRLFYTPVAHDILYINALGNL